MAHRSAAHAVSLTLRARIAEGHFTPGSKISESTLATDLGVSRNTLREAFRLLTHDGLLVHEFNRGVFVADVTSEDVRDVYRFRRIIEPGAVRQLRRADRFRLGDLAAAVRAGRSAVQAGAWTEAGTANGRFHTSLVALAGSPRLDAAMHRLMAELRLVFASLADPRALHEPFVERNGALLAVMEQGEFAQAADDLDGYLEDSEGYILAAFEESERTA